MADGALPLAHTLPCNRRAKKFLNDFNTCPSSVHKKAAIACLFCRQTAQIAGTDPLIFPSRASLLPLIALWSSTLRPSPWPALSDLRYIYDRQDRQGDGTPEGRGRGHGRRGTPNKAIRGRRGGGEGSMRAAAGNRAATSSMLPGCNYRTAIAAAHHFPHSLGPTTPPTPKAGASVASRGPSYPKCIFSRYAPNTYKNF